MSSTGWSAAWFSTGRGTTATYVAVRAHADRMRILAPLALTVALLCVATPRADAREQSRGEWPLRPPPEVIERFHPPDSPFGAGQGSVDGLADVTEQVDTAVAG